MSDMIFEGDYPQEDDIVRLKESFKVELKGVPGQTFIYSVIKKGSEGKVIRNFGWYISIEFKGFEVEIHDIKTYDKHIHYFSF